jgi:hypothetical protein
MNFPWYPAHHFGYSVVLTIGSEPTATRLVHLDAVDDTVASQGGGNVSD